MYKVCTGRYTWERTGEITFTGSFVVVRPAARTRCTNTLGEHAVWIQGVDRLTKEKM